MLEEGKRRAAGPPTRKASEVAHLQAVFLLGSTRAAPIESTRTFRIPHHRSLTRMAAVRTTTTKRISNPKPLKFENLSRIQSYEPARIDQLGLSVSRWLVCASVMASQIEIIILPCTQYPIYYLQTNSICAFKSIALPTFAKSRRSYKEPKMENPHNKY